MTTGLGILRERGLFDRYTAALLPHHREAVLALVAGSWLPTEFMIAHYAAWDSLALSPEQIRAIGTNVASGVRDNMFRALKHLTTGAGVTPWTLLGQHARLWARAFDGGGVRVDRSGPKDATLFFTELPFSRSPYFQGSLLAIHQRVLGTFSTKLYAQLVRGSVRDSSLAMRLAWV